MIHIQRRFAETTNRIGIDSDNGLSPIQRQAIIQTNALFIVNWT